MLFTCKNSDLNHLKTLVYESKSHTKLHYNPLGSHLEYDVILPLSITLKQNLRVFSESICLRECLYQRASCYPNLKYQASFFTLIPSTNIEVYLD